jgi:hypothetical protein
VEFDDVSSSNFIFWMEVTQKREDGQDSLWNIRI